MPSNKKAAKKERRKQRVHHKNSGKVILNEEKFMQLEDKERIAILFDPNLSCVEKCNIVYEGSLPVIPDDGSSAEIVNIREEALSLFAYFIIKFATILGRNETVNANTSEAYTKLHKTGLRQLEPVNDLCFSLVEKYHNEDEAKSKLMSLKLEISDGLDKMSEFIEARKRGDFVYKDGIDDYWLEVNGTKHPRELYVFRIKFAYGCPLSLLKGPA